MNNRQSLYLLWATILNQSQSAEIVLKNTFELFKRLNLLSNFDKEYNNCRGGCRYRCFKNGDINGIDPFCYLKNNLLDVKK